MVKRRLGGGFLGKRDGRSAKSLNPTGRHREGVCAQRRPRPTSLSPNLLAWPRRGCAAWPKPHEGTIVPRRCGCRGHPNPAPCARPEATGMGWAPAAPLRPEPCEPTRAPSPSLVWEPILCPLAHRGVPTFGRGTAPGPDAPLGSAGHPSFPSCGAVPGVGGSSLGSHSPHFSPR